MSSGSVPIPPGLLRKGKNNKYGKHSIQNNMFIQRAAGERPSDVVLLPEHVCVVCVGRVRREEG